MNDAPPPGELEVLAARHREFLSFLERRVGDRRLAEDILQDAFVRTLDCQAPLRSPDSSVAWFYRVLRNAVVDRHRRAAASARGLEALARALDPPTADPEIDHAICRCVVGLLPTLKPEYADALRRIDVDGLAVKDFAREAGITDSNAGVRVFRARRALRRKVERACRTCAEHGCLDCTCSPPASA